MRQKLVAFLPFEQASPIRVLDLGTGTGALSQEVLSAYPMAEIVCPDFSEPVLLRARQRLAEYSRQMSFVQSDLRDPAWRNMFDGKFERVCDTAHIAVVKARLAELDASREVTRRIRNLTDWL